MIRISTPSIEGSAEAAKWLKIQALIDPVELSSLMEALSPFEIYPLAGAHPLEAFPMQKEMFLAAARAWTESIQVGADPGEFGALNASMWSLTPEALWLQKLPKGYIARPCLPYLQVQVHRMGYSEVDKVFRPMTLSQDSIFWGLQFSFPQIFQHPDQGILNVAESPNAEMFQIVRKWSRENTVSTPMMVLGVRENLPIRLGKRCFPWINRHPQLQAKNLSVLELFYGN